MQGSVTSNVFLGQSPKTRQIRRLIDKLGQCRWPVLILGETGTGKEVVARAIHNANPDGPLVTIDCSSLVGPLMESELFGHTRGAFTGALATKIGLIELANGGTAFLDEIGELPLDLQAKLLRVLQEKEFRPIGSLLQKKSDFRIIAATNRDLAKEVERGTFRRDLFYRLNVVTLKLPPLRDRHEDIQLLVDHFLAKYGRNHILVREVIDALLSYEWPGNVRELENCIQHMVAINTGPLLHQPDLPSSIQNHLIARKAQCAIAAASAAATTPVSIQPNSTLRDDRNIDAPVVPLTELEKRAIVQALDYTRGDRMMAAALLGIGRTTLYRKLKEYRLDG